jgi:hypothetical protein
MADQRRLRDRLINVRLAAAKRYAQFAMWAGALSPTKYQLINTAAGIAPE